MKLVQLLAKELKEWPEGISCMVQDGSGKICTCRNGFPDPHDGDWTICGPKSMGTTVDWVDIGSGKHEIASDQKSSIITLEKWQAEREKMNKPKWIRHRGGKCPVADDVKVLYRMRSGTITSRGEPSSILSWDHSKIGADIMAYRIIEETKDQEIEEVKKTNFGTITYKLEIDATEATKEIDSLVAKWGQIESPLKWRDEIIELEAYEEEFRREREKLIRKLESEGFKLMDHINCNLDKIDQTLDNSSDMSDWRNWRAGDTVECLVVPGKHTGYYFSGENYNVRCVDLDDEGTSSEVDIYCAEGLSLWCPSSSFKFVSRP